MVNLIRLLKIKKHRGELNNLSDLEKHLIYEFDGLVRVPDKIIDTVSNVYQYDAYAKGDTIKFMYFHDTDFGCSISIINEMSYKFNISRYEVKRVIKRVLNDILKVKCNDNIDTIM